MLELIGAVVIPNAASPNVLVEATVNVDAENPDSPLFTVITTLPLASVKFALAACVMAMVAVPTPLIRTSDASKKETTAILSLEKVKTLPPIVSVLVDDGESLNDEFP